MRNPRFNQHLIATTGEHLSRKSKSIRAKNKEGLILSRQLSEPLYLSSSPIRATTPVTRNLLLGLVWTTMMANEVLAQEEKGEIFDKEKFNDIFKADSGPLSQPNSTKPLYKTKPKEVYQKLIETHSDNFLAQPDREIVFESFPEEILSGFLNQKNFNHKDKGALNFLTYLAYQEQKQANFLGILKHSVTNSRKNIDLLNLLTSQVDGNGNNILHISCIMNNIDHLSAIFQNFNSARFSFSDQKSAIDRLKKDMIMKFNDDQFTPLMQAVKDNRLEMVNKILSESKSFDNVDYSFDVLMQVNKSGNSPLLLAIKDKNYQLLESLLVNFDSYTSEQKTQIQNVFKDSHKQISDDLLLSAVNNDSDNISQIIKTLKKINCSKVELKDLLTEKNSNGDSAIILLAFTKKIDSIIEIINEFDGKSPEEKELLKETLLQQNKYGNSALDFLITENPDDKIIEVLKALERKFSKADLKDLLTAKNSIGDSAIILLAFKQRIGSIIEIINEFDGKSPEEKELLKETLLHQNKYGNSALDFLIDKNPDDKIIEVLKTLENKLSKDELKDLLTEKNSNGNSAIIPLAFNQRIGSIIEIINGFDGKNPEERRLLKEILLQQNKYGDSALDLLITENPDDKIIEVLKALKNKLSKDELKDLLTEKRGNGNLAIVNLAKNGMIESILSVISAFDIDEEVDRNHLKEIFLKRSELGYSALYRLVNSSSNESNLKCIKKIISIFSNEEIETFLTKKVDNYRILTIQTSLVLAGNDRLVEEILKRGVEIKIDELPTSYYAKIPNVAVYYLEAFKKDEDNQIKEIKYYNSDNKDGVDILNLRLNDDRDDPLIVEIIAKDQSSRKVIITETSILNSDKKINATNLNLQNTFKLAESAKIDQIIINLNIELYDFPKNNSHALTIKLTKNDGGWDIIYHDPNSLLEIGLLRPEEWKQTNEKAIREICEQNNIKINSIAEHENIIANDIVGSCDTISSIVGASMIIGDDHSQKLATKCRDYFDYDKSDKSKILSTEGCIRHIGGDTLNKEVKSILDAKLELIKSKMDKAPSSLILPLDTSLQTKISPDTPEL